MEGISNEACSLAGHWGLGKLIVFYDDNHISIDGDTAIAFTENVEDRFAAMGWHILFVENGNTDYDAIRQSIVDAKAVTDKPTFIKVMLYFQLMFLADVWQALIEVEASLYCSIAGYHHYRVWFA